MAEKLFFDTIKEHRGSYFVEYQPAGSGFDFAILSLVFPEPVERPQAIDSLKVEVARWLERYPVPIMASAFDATEGVIGISESFDERHLVGWLNSEASQVEMSWNLNDLTTFMNSWPSPTDWRAIYADIPFRTEVEIKAHADKRLRERRVQIRVLKFVLALWLSAVPATLALIGFFGPEVIGFVVLVYSLWKAWRAWEQLAGYAKPSEREAEKAEKRRKMEHYYYHCERNPEGFLRLRSENFQKSTVEQTQQEARQLAASAGQRQKSGRRDAT